MDTFLKRYKKQESLIIGTMPDGYQVEICDGNHKYIKFHDKDACRLMIIEEKKTTCYVCLSVDNGGLFGVYFTDAMTHLSTCLSRLRQNLFGGNCTLCGTHWLDKERTLHPLTEEHIKSPGHQQLVKKAAQNFIHMMDERVAADKIALVRSKAEFFLNGGVMNDDSAVPYVKTAMDIIIAYPNLDDVPRNAYVDVFYKILGKIGSLEIIIIMKALEQYKEIGAKVYETICVPADGRLEELRDAQGRE